MRYRYYSTQRPVAPGTFPKPKDNKLMGIRNYDERTFFKTLGKNVWGYVEYSNPLDPRVAEEYELTYGGCYDD